MSTLSERLESLGEAIVEDPRRAAWMAANLEDPTNADKHAELGDKMKKVYEEIMQNPNMITFMEAQQELSDMVQEINARIQFFITGEEPTACDGNCASCGGSCGN